MSVPQVSADPDLIPVLSLWPLAKVSNQTEASCHLQTPKIWSRNVADQVGASHPQPKMSPEVLEPRHADCCQKSLLLRGLGGAECPARNMPPAICKLVGAGSQGVPGV